MKRTTVLGFALISALSLALATGCQQTAGTSGTTGDEGGHAHAETLDAAVEELEMLTERLDMSVSGDERGELDDMMHEIGHVIGEEMTGLIATSELSDEDKTKATEAASRVMELLEPLHLAMHDGTKLEEIDLSLYTNNKDSIKAAVEELCALAGHDHDGEDKDGAEHKDGDHDDGEPGDKEDHKDGDGDKHDDDAEKATDAKKDAGEKKPE